MAKKATKTAAKPAPKKTPAKKEIVSLGLNDAVMGNRPKTSAPEKKKAAKPIIVTKKGDRQNINETVVYGPLLYERYPNGTHARIDHLPKDSVLAEMFPEAGVAIEQRAPGVWVPLKSNDIETLEKVGKKSVLILPDETELFIISVPLS